MKISIIETVKIAPLVGAAFPYQWEAFSEDYDKGDPIGYGRTIPEALEAFEESFLLKNDVQPKYKWK
jgi:hypothetical protein